MDCIICVIFDTSVLIALERDSRQIDSIVKGREEEGFGLSVITVSELLHGVRPKPSAR